jgi:predicted deacylase
MTTLPPQANILRKRVDVETNLAYFRHHGNGFHGGMTIDSGRRGNHILIIGALHGNEPVGVEAMVRLHHWMEKRKRDMRGRVSFLMANPLAYRRGARCVDIDLNRAFRPLPLRTYESRRADEIRDFLDHNGKPDAALDLHSVSSGNIQMLVYDSRSRCSMALAERIGATHWHFSFDPRHIPGSLISETAAKGIPSVAVECGNHNAPGGLRMALEHAQNLIHQSGLLSVPRARRRRPIVVQRYTVIQPVVAGKGFRYLSAGLATGHWLKRGAKFCWDDERGFHVAPRDCWIAMPDHEVHPGNLDAGFLCDLQTKVFERHRRPRRSPLRFSGDQGVA